MIDKILELIAKKLAAFEKGYPDNWTDLSTTMIINNSTWIAPSNGIMAVHIDPAINSASYIFLPLDPAGLLRSDDDAHAVAQDLGGSTAGPKGQDDPLGPGCVGGTGLPARDEVGDVAGHDSGVGPGGVGSQ